MKDLVAELIRLSGEIYALAEKAKSENKYDAFMALSEIEERIHALRRTLNEEEGQQ